jgi:hypothetical protein
MTEEPYETVMLSNQPLNSPNAVIRAPPIATDGIGAARLLLSVTAIGSVSGSDTLTVCPLFVDADGNEYISADPYYGTIALTGSSMPIAKSVDIPDPGNHLGLKVVGGSMLGPAEGFFVSARVHLIPLWPLE